MFNCKHSDLHFNFRAYDWACSAEFFDHSDVFVMEHRFCYKYLQNLFVDVKKSLLPSFGGFRKVEMSYLGWAMLVAVWFNKAIKNTDYKFKQLYLYGPSNEGKSTYIESIIGKQNMKYVYYPSNGNFAFAGLDVRVHKLILFEEFKIYDYDRSMLKRLLEGRIFAAPIKCLPDRLIKFTGPIIIVTNCTDSLNDLSIRNRLYFVEANEAHYEMEAEPLPKEEEVSIETSCNSSSSVISLSSEESS